MATDPNLSDSNLPESSANLGFEDWTGSKGVLDKDITWLRDAFIKHLGQDYWNSRNEYPHPNQAVSTLLFFEGNGRLDDTGIQIIADAATTRGFHWVLQLSDDPDAAEPRAYITSTVDPIATQITVGSFIDTTHKVAATAHARDAATGSSYYSVIATDGASSDELIFDVNEVTSTSALLLDRAYLGLAPRGTDPPTLRDGALWYRTDTDTIRARINGATVDLLSTASVIVLSNLDLPYVSVAVNTTTTSSQCFIDVDAAGANRTITLPSAATLGSGFTYVIRKLDSSNNTVTVDPNSTQLINASQTYVLNKQYETLTIVSNGTNWDIWSTYKEAGLTAVSGTYTTLDTDTVITANASGGAFTITLITAVGNTGLTYTIRKIGTDTNVVTIDGNGSQTIEGATTLGLMTPGEYVTLTSDGANWIITGQGA